MKWAFAALAAAIATPASAADTIEVTSYAWNPGSVLGDFHLAGSSSLNPYGYDITHGDVAVGRFELNGTINGTAVQLFTYCVDLLLGVGNGTYDILPASSQIGDPAKVNYINALLTHTNPLLDAALGQDKINISAATQMAIWEIVTENPANGYSLSSGDFYMDFLLDASRTQAQVDAFDTVKSIAANYLTLATGSGPGHWSPTAGANVTVLHSSRLQSQVYLTSVPEPATWAIMISGFGLVAVGLRRRRKAIAASAAA